METMALGSFAFMTLVISVCCLHYKKSIWGLVSSVTAIILTYLTGRSWRLMLTSSGKDTTLLGFNRYPAALMILSVLLLGAFALMIVSVVGIIKKNKSKV